MNIMEKFAEIGMNLSNQRHMDAVKNGVMASLPATLAGSLFLIIRFLPVPGWNTVLESVLGSDYGLILSYPVAATFDMVGLIALFSIAYHLAASYKVPALSGAIIALCGYFTLTPSFLMQDIAQLDEALRVNGVWGLNFTGPKSLFVVILCAILSIEIYRRVIQKGLVIKLPDMVPPNVSNNFVAIIPMLLVLITMWILRIIVEITPFESVHNLINSLIQVPLLKLGNTVFGYASLIFFKDLFWTIGIHGPNIMSPILAPLEITFQQANRLAYEAGEALPFILLSLAGIFIGYFSMSSGLVSRMPGVEISWTPPPILNAYIGYNGRLSVVLAQLVTLAVTAVIYYPFFRIVDNQALKEELGTSTTESEPQTTVVPEGVALSKSE